MEDRGWGEMYKDQSQDEESQRLLKKITAAVKHTKPTNLSELQSVVDRVHGLAGIVAAAEDHCLTLEELTTLGVSLENDMSTGWASIEGLWDPVHDIKNSKSSHNSYLGTRFLEWMVNEKRRHDKTHGDACELLVKDFLPPVDIAIKVYRVDGLDMSRNEFSAEFVVMLDWEDPSLHLMRSHEVYEVAHHFCPKYGIANVARVDELECGPSRPTRGKKPSWRVKWTRKVHATLKTLFDPAKYPFDFQLLDIVIDPWSVSSDKLSLLSLPSNGRFPLRRNSLIQLQHPIRWRRSRGHTLAINADWLPDFHVIGINGERSAVGAAVDAYKVTIAIMRDPTNVLYGTITSMSALTLVASFSFFVHTLQHSLSLSMTGLLAAIATKLIVTNRLPLTPQPSIVEVFIVWCYLHFALVAIMNVTLHLLTINYVKDQDCNPKEDNRVLEASNSTMEDMGFLRCWHITFLARTCFGFSILMLISQLLYMASRATYKSARRHFIEATWSCVNWGLPDGLFRKNKSVVTFIKTISVAPQHLLKKTFTFNRRAKVEKTIYFRKKKARWNPAIYCSPKISCLYTVGDHDMTLEQLHDVAISSPWCAQIEAAKPSQRLSFEPGQLENCYHTVKFRHVCDISSFGPCMEALHDNCELCAEGKHRRCNRSGSGLGFRV